MPAPTAEHRSIPLARAQVRSEARGDRRVITGYAAVFFVESDPESTQYQMWPDLVERIMPGAFDAAIREDDVRGLYDHNPYQLFGRSRPGDSSSTLRLSIDAVGLRYEADLPDTQLGRDLAQLLERRDIDGSSFGFDVSSRAKRSDVTWREINGVTIREIRALELLDVGPCAFPAYLATSADVRSAGDHATLLAARDEWRARQRHVGHSPEDDVDALLLFTSGRRP